MTKKNSLTNTKKETFSIFRPFSRTQAQVVGNYSNARNHFTRLHSCDEHESIEVVTMIFNHDFEFYRRLDYNRYQNFAIALVDECSSCSKRQISLETRKKAFSVNLPRLEFILQTFLIRLLFHTFSARCKLEYRRKVYFQVTRSQNNVTDDKHGCFVMFGSRKTSDQGVEG